MLTAEVVTTGTELLITQVVTTRSDLLTVAVVTTGPKLLITQVVATIKIGLEIKIQYPSQES
jgi:molybdopterin-biosynthesis enzyme MoeA-like protein